MITRCFGCMEEFDNSYGMCPHCGYEPDTEIESPIHMQPGVLLHGRYLIGKVLGFGGFGVTYIGWDFTLQLKVAIKEYLPSEFATRMIGQTQITVFGGKKEEQFDDGMEQFVEEAKRLAQFQNEDGIVRIFDSFAENNTAYIVMEYLEGETLTAYLERNGKIDGDKAIEMLVPVLKSLEIVHKAGIIHRDIAPDNIFLTKSGEVKLIDFGAARYATTSHSRSLTVIIKPGYSPEEQYRSRGDQGPHTDVYAIGAVLYRMITGTVLPDSMERRACFEKNGKDIVVPPSKNGKLTKNQETAVMNALNVRVEDRTPTAAKLLEELTAQKPVKRLLGKIKVTDLMRWPLWAKILIPSAGVAVVTLLVLLLTGVIGPKGSLMTDISLAENEARVPSVVNYSVDLAYGRLAEQGLDCRIIGAEYSDMIPNKTVIYQSIAAAQVVEKDTVVDVQISTDLGGAGIEEGSMPYVVYKNGNEAAELLKSMGMTVRTETVYDDLIAEGLVVAQSMEPGTDISNGGSVTLEISKGENPNKREPSSELVVLSREEYNLYVGDSVNLYAEGGTGSYSYESSDETVVTVSRKGEMTAVGAGTATITVSSGKKAEAAVCQVEVQDYTMTLMPDSLTMFADATAVLSVSGIPGNAQVVWTSGNEEVATVNENGKVTGIATGETTITATWDNGTKTYQVEVPVVVETAGITLDIYKISSFYVGETRTIKASTAPADQQVTWTSENDKVATVSSSGVVTAVGGGTTNITAGFTLDGKTYSETCEVTVIQPGVSLSKSNVSFFIGDSTPLTSSVTPSGTEVTWSCDDTGIAKVSGGKVVGVGAGTTTVRVKMTFAGKNYEATCKVTVTKPGVTLSKTSISLLPGASDSLTGKANPSSCEIKWSSSNNNVAKISNGKVTAGSVGTATITAQITYKDKTYKSTCNVTVAEPSISVSSSSGTITFAERDSDRQTATLTANVTPDGGKVTWESSNSSVAPVSGNGKTATVKAMAEGTATITATYSIAGTTVKDQCTITVQKAASTLKVYNLSYPKRGSVNDFYFDANISSNYSLVKLSGKGSAKSNALGISVSDTPDPLYFDAGLYEAGPRESNIITQYLINQYKSLYNLYVALANLVGADDSLTMTINSTVQDASGATVSFTIVYILDE